MLHLIAGDEGYGVATVLRQFYRHFPEVAFIAVAPGKMAAEFAGSRLIWVGSQRLGIRIQHSSTGALLSLLLGIPRMWQIGRQIALNVPSGPILIHCHSLQTALVAGIARILRGRGEIKVLFHFHSTMNRRRLLGLIAVLQRQVIGHSADGIVAVSRAVSEYWKPIACPVWVVHNGMEAHTGSAPSYFKRKLGLSEVLLAGSLSQEKGQLVAVEALHLLGGNANRFHLWIAGGPIDPAVNPFAVVLKDAIRRYRLDAQVTLLGEKSDLRDLASAVDIGLQLRVTVEPCSMWVLEALAAGLPLVASSTGGTPELVRHEMEGLLVPPGDPAAVAEALWRLSEDLALRARLSASAAKRAQEFSVGNFVAKIRAIYAQFNRAEPSAI